MSLLDKTLQELDGEDWGEPTYPSHLVTECHRLRRVPLKDFRVEDLRILIGQNFSLEYLVPLALEQLEANPWIDGNFYEGDLLQNVLSIPNNFWKTHPELKVRLDSVAVEALAQAETAPKEDELLYERHVVAALREWRERTS